MEMFEYTWCTFMPSFLCMMIDHDPPFNLLTNRRDDGLSVGHGGPAPFAFANLLLAAAVSGAACSSSLAKQVFF
jgi:hypothetical protein